MPVIQDSRTKPVGLAKDRSNGIQMQKFRHVLLIDDDEIFVFLTRKMLQGSAQVERITVCRSGREALQFLDSSLGIRSVPDVIFLDLNMPEMTGWEFLEHYQDYLDRAKAAPRLYIVSSSVSTADEDRALQTRGVNGFHSKPLHAEGIRSLLRLASGENPAERKRG